MQLLETLRIELARIGVPDDWREGLDTVVVDGIARQVAEGRPVNPLRVDDQYQLVQGRHRLAGHFNAGANEVLVQVVSYDSAAEREEDTLLENLCRRTLTADERDRGLARLFELAMDAADDPSNDATIPQSAEGSRQKKTKAAVASDVAAKTNQKQSTVERAVRKQAAPPAEVIVPKPPKPVPIEKLILEFAAKVQALAEDGPALLKSALIIPHEDIKETEAVWGKNQPRGGEWRIRLKSFVEALQEAPGRLRMIADDIVRGRAALALNDHKAKVAAREEKARKPLGLSDPPKVGLKAPSASKRVKVVDGETGNLLAEGTPSGLPPVQDTANAWADAGRVGIGPEDESDEAF